MQFGAKPLFENISVKFGGGNRYGLIGANGCGKSGRRSDLTAPESSTLSTEMLETGFPPDKPPATINLSPHCADAAQTGTVTVDSFHDLPSFGSDGSGQVQTESAPSGRAASGVAAASTVFFDLPSHPPCGDAGNPGRTPDFSSIFCATSDDSAANERPCRVVQNRQQTRMNRRDAIFQPLKSFGFFMYRLCWRSAPWVRCVMNRARRERGMSLSRPGVIAWSPDAFLTGTPS